MELSENMLMSLFDFQKFEGNAALEEVIGEVHARYAARELSLEEAGMVWAAGIPGTMPENKDLK